MGSIPIMHRPVFDRAPINAPIKSGRVTTRFSPRRQPWQVWPLNKNMPLTLHFDEKSLSAIVVLFLWQPMRTRIYCILEPVYREICETHVFLYFKDISMKTCSQNVERNWRKCQNTWHLMFKPDSTSFWKYQWPE